MRQAVAGKRAPDSESFMKGRQRAIVCRLADGDAAALSELLDLFWAPLVRYAIRVLGTQDAAEDVVQEAFIRLWETREQLDAGKSVRGFLYRIVHNRTVDELRRRRLRGDRSIRLRAALPTPPTPAELTQAGQLEAAAAHAIEALADRRREVFVLAHLHGLSYREISEALGISPRTVANHMTLALRELRIALRPFLGRDPGSR